jgi:hypothetical protein
MNRKPIARISLVVMFAVTAFAFSATPAAATPTSPGACNMLHTSANGFAGMFKAAPQGLGNMIALVIASEEGGCTV